MSCDRFSPSSLIRSIGSVRALAGSAFASALAGSLVAGFVASFDAGLLGGGSWARSARGSRKPERAINNNFLKRMGMDAGLRSWMEMQASRSENLDDDGYKAEEAGHDVESIRPSYVPGVKESSVSLPEKQAGILARLVIARFAGSCSGYSVFSNASVFNTQEHREGATDPPGIKSPGRSFILGLIGIAGPARSSKALSFNMFGIAKLALRVMSRGSSKASPCRRFSCSPPRRSARWTAAVLFPRPKDWKSAPC